jgi:uncharacterized membrane protein YphA (DoxX/SURF4 family)
MRRGSILTAIRVFLAIVFISYGVVKLFGGQFYYGDWTIDKKTVGGPFLVWAFYGYSPVYARFIALAELVPGIMLLIPRLATVGAAALFAVSLNVTVMDFAFDFPDVKYAALVYTALLGVLLWADRERLRLLVAPQGRAGGAGFRWTIGRSVAAGGVGAFVTFAANLILTALAPGPEAAAAAVVKRHVEPGEQVELVRSRYTGLFGINRTATIEFAVKKADGGSRREVFMHARKTNGFTPWRVVDDSSGNGLKKSPSP